MTKKNTNSIKNKARKPILEKRVLQNKPVTFRPTDEIKEFLNNIQEVGGNKSKTINEALLLYKQLKTEPKRLLDKLCLKYPFLWRSINRRNGQFITQKIRLWKKKK